MSKVWLIVFCATICTVLIPVGRLVYRIDPFFHYHAPRTDKYFYVLDNERSQNDGIIKHFDYTAVIAGSSMTQNFKTSEAESLWGGKWIKVPFAGGLYKEIGDAVELALCTHPKIDKVIRCLDITVLFTDKDEERSELGLQPKYLFNKNPFDDVKYVLNKSIVFERCAVMRLRSVPSGHTSFDEYSSWTSSNFGPKSVFKDANGTARRMLEERLSRAGASSGVDWRVRLRENVRCNVVKSVREHPQTTFYYFLPPYSAGYWYATASLGEDKLNRTLEGMGILIEELIKFDNVKLFGFDNCYALTCDLNHYKDMLHYGEWVNSKILKWMKEDVGRLNRDNYKSYLASLRETYGNMDWDKLFAQPENPSGITNRLNNKE